MPEDLKLFMHMTLATVIEKFGTDARFLDFLKAVQTIEAINEKRLKNAQTEGELVARDIIRYGVIEPIDNAHIKLLTDGARTIATRSDSMSKANKTVADIEAFVKDQIGSYIRPMKDKVHRNLANV